MSQRAQQDGINACRAYLDDAYDGKTIFQFSPLLGLQDGTNRVFQIPQMRIVVNPTLSVPVIPTFYEDDEALVFNTDWTVLNTKAGIFQFTVAPLPTVELKVTFNFTWMDDIELDHMLNRAANEIGYTTYYTSASTVPNTEPIPVGGSQPTDIPDGLYNAIVKLASAYAAKAIALRFSTKFDFGTGDQNYNPSQMADHFKELAEDLMKEGYNARDDYYKGQGRQYSPSTSQQGYVLPPVTPPR